jgi:hypothetical protein
MLRDLAAVLQPKNSNRAAREKLAPQHIYVNPRARSSGVDSSARARGARPLSVQRAERFIRHNRAFYGVVRRLPSFARSGVSARALCGINPLTMGVTHWSVSV